MVSRSRLRTFAVAAALFVLAVPSLGLAQPSAADKETARSLMSQGDKAYDSKDYPAALQAYKGAHAIMAVPETGIWLAKTQAALGQLLEARDTALEVTRMPAKPNEPGAFARARAEADTLAKALAPRIPSITVKVDAPASAKVVVAVDGVDLPDAVRTLPRKVDPGKHAITAKAEGYRTAQSDVVVKEAEETTASLQLVAEGAAGAAVPPPASEAPHTGMSPLVPVGFVAGGLGAIAGGIGLGAMLQDQSILANDRCIKFSLPCPASVKSDQSTTSTMGIVAGVGFGVAGAGVAVGVVGLVLGGGGSKPAATAPPAAWVKPYVTTTGGGLVGSF